ncbi:MFS transporter [Sediminicoccus sp. KRV36]|uniref:MFS transporter n=1 Tax=Sediminicoccus sp. KRV36 TaxID=3133721 RepID=UPI00200F8977|nr:MFS transporter [Sediminicoccus rosea]UPY39172.1 MFS transporter [Sediminicoccus rosea]
MTPAEARRLFPLLLGTLVVPFDTALNVAFPQIIQAFDLPLPAIQWLIIAYVLTYGSLMLAVGRIGDIWGHARVFRFGLCWSAMTMLLCALAPSYGALLFCRVLQGVGAAFVIGCGAALATSLYPEAMRARALAAYAAGFAACSALGPLLGGLLVAWGGWQAVFWIRVPVALLALWLLRGGLVPPRPAGPRESFDGAGALLLALGMASLLLAINRGAIPLFLMAGLALGGFAWRSLGVARPILDLRLFRRPGFARLNLASLLVNLAGFGVMLLVPFYLASVAALPPAWVGGVLAAGHLGSMLGSALGGRLGGGPRCALAGAGLGGAGLLMIAFWGPGTSAWLLLAALLLQGFGIGLFTLAYTDMITASMRREDRGVAGSLTLLTRTLGIVLAASLLTLVFGAGEAGALAAGAAPMAGFLAGFGQAFWVAGALPFLALALLLRRWG